MPKLNNRQNVASAYPNCHINSWKKAEKLQRWSLQLILGSSHDSLVELQRAAGEMGGRPEKVAPLLERRGRSLGTSERSEWNPVSGLGHHPLALLDPRGPDEAPDLSRFVGPCHYWPGLMSSRPEPWQGSWCARSPVHHPPAFGLLVSPSSVENGGSGRARTLEYYHKSVFWSMEILTYWVRKYCDFLAKKLRVVFICWFPG